MHSPKCARSLTAWRGAAARFVTPGRTHIGLSLVGCGRFSLTGLVSVFSLTGLGPVGSGPAEELTGVDGVAVGIGDRCRLDHRGQRQPPPYVGEHGGQLVVLLQESQQLLRLDTVLP